MRSIVIDRHGDNWIMNKHIQSNVLSFTSMIVAGKESMFQAGPPSTPVWMMGQRSLLQTGTIWAVDVMVELAGNTH
jgi:hypothetical protein